MSALRREPCPPALDERRVVADKASRTPVRCGLDVRTAARPGDERWPAAVRGPRPLIRESRRSPPTAVTQRPAARVRRGALRRRSRSRRRRSARPTRAAAGRAGRSSQTRPPPRQRQTVEVEPTARPLASAIWPASATGRRRRRRRRGRGRAGASRSSTRGSAAGSGLRAARSGQAPISPRAAFRPSQPSPMVPDDQHHGRPASPRRAARIRPPEPSPAGSPTGQRPGRGGGVAAQQASGRRRPGPRPGPARRPRAPASRSAAGQAAARK